MVLDGCLDALDVMNFGEELGIQVRLEGSYNEFKKASFVPLPQNFRETR